jgi:Xaa-Pro aminopeptidase
MSSAAALTAAQRLARLRSFMVARGLAAYIVPSTDAHCSEYVPAKDERRAYLTGFTGSAGTAVVTAPAPVPALAAEPAPASAAAAAAAAPATAAAAAPVAAAAAAALLWTDGRYFAQAARELDGAHWTLMRDRLPETPSIEAWLASALPPSAVVGCDGALMPLVAVQRLRAALEPKGIRLACGSEGDGEPNLVDAVWAGDAGAAPQPPPPAAPLFALPARVADAGGAAAKLARVRGALAAEGADALVVSALDEVAWLLDVRGGDIACCPVALSYALVHARGPVAAELFVDGAKVDAATRAHLEAAGVALRPYADIWPALRATAGRVWLDAASSSQAVYAALAGRAGGGDAGAGAGAAASLLQRMSPIQLMKAVKSEREAAGMRAAHVRDGVALARFFSWLEAAVTRGVDARAGAPAAAPAAALAATLTEHGVCAVLEAFRAAQADYVGPSFPTIAGAGANGAVIHYRPEPASAAAVTASAVFLCDSGGQYLDGTTDVTRTLHFGAPSAHERRAYTRVLQGHIALARAVFPAGASGVALDAVARAPLWADCLDYRHGTGHGVGAFLNVHEGPFGIAPQVRTAYEGGVAQGFVLSNEPGYYEDGAFGVRIENLALVVPAPPPPHARPFGDKPWLAFDNLTLVPMCKALTDDALLAPAERDYLDAYHARCRDTLRPLLDGDGAGDALAREWLDRETQPCGSR